MSQPIYFFMAAAASPTRLGGILPPPSAAHTYNHGNLSDLFGFLSLGWGNIGIFWFGVMLGFGLSGGAFWN
jgi:hypothetical protein